MLKRIGLLTTCHSLPFLLPLSATLGIAVADYLTEAAKLPNAPSAAAKQKLIEEGEGKFVYATDLGKSFENAWKIWDAVSPGSDLCMTHC